MRRPKRSKIEVVAPKKEVVVSYTHNTRRCHAAMTGTPFITVRLQNFFFLIFHFLKYPPVMLQDSFSFNIFDFGHKRIEITLSKMKGS